MDGWTGRIAPRSRAYAPAAWHAAIFDPPRDRILLFGYSDCYPMGYWNTLREFPLAASQAWANVAIAGTPPAGRVRHSLVYDPVRDRMLMFGGDPWGSSYLDEVWELSLTGTPAWTPLSPSGGSPSPRNSHTAIYDPVRDAMVVFGGVGAGGRLNDVWSLSLGPAPTWTPLAASGTPPSGRSRHSAIYDPVRDRMVVFGGFDAAASRPTMPGRYRSGRCPPWTQLTPQGTLPALRQGHEAICDPPRDRMVIYGGHAPPEDLWALEWGSVVSVDPTTEQDGLALAVRPNPAAGAITVDFSLPRTGAASLRIYDVSGRLARVLFDGEASAGSQRHVWNGRTESGARARAGVYLIRLRSGTAEIARRIAVVE